jgi:hypothetical protein
MTRPSIFVVGAEGAGTTLLWKCVIAHPDLRTMVHAHFPRSDIPITTSDLILHLSLPTLRPPRWVQPDELPPAAKVIVTRRAAIHTVYSAYRRFHADPADAWRNYFRALQLEGRYVAQRDPLCVCYEDLVHHPAKVLRSVYEFLGVRAGFLPSIELVDQNDGRWQRDRVFGAFMRNAFGFRDDWLPDPMGTDRVEPAHATPAARELAVDCHGVRVSVVDETGGGVCGRLRRRLPPNTTARDAGAPAVRYIVRRAEASEGAGQVYHVLCGGEVRIRARTVKRVVASLRSEIDRDLAVHSREGLFVHAGVVGWRGRAILIPGRSMTGKSSLVAALIRCGAAYYSDEYAILDEDGRVHPYARAPVLRGRAPLAWPPSADELPGGVGEQPLPVSLIVSTTYRPGATWQPEAMYGARAVLPITTARSPLAPIPCCRCTTTSTSTNSQGQVVGQEKLNKKKKKKKK